jgi:hypothetical protein
MQPHEICQEKARQQPGKANGWRLNAHHNRYRRAVVYSVSQMRLSFVVPLACVLVVFPGYLHSQNSGSDDYSGMYSFLRDGEFIQITIEEKGAVSGFISRFGDSESDRGAFLDQFFKSGKLEAKKLSFTTENVHGNWFTFEGTFDRGPGKTPNEEGFYVVRGTLTRFSTGDDKRTNSQVRKVEFRSFPRDAAPN